MGPPKQKKGEEGAALLLFGSRLSGDPGCPFRERPFSDRSLFALRLRRHLNVDVLAPELAVAKRDVAVTECKQGMALPRPTLSPGYHFVPRWRTMMLPASTASPPNLTPRRDLVAAVARSRLLSYVPSAKLYFLALPQAFAALAGAASFVDFGLAGAAAFPPDRGLLLLGGRLGFLRRCSSLGRRFSLLGLRSGFFCSALAADRDDFQDCVADGGRLCGGNCGGGAS